MKLLLGSNSPRRNELLIQLGYTFTKVKIDCNEDFLSSLPIEEVAEYLAKKKSLAYTSLSENEILITADTVVISEGKILNKPKDREEARTMLTMLSGKIHQVKTGICIRSLEKGESLDTATTSVTIKELTDKEILFYIDTYKPYDKAGAYGIQEWFGLTCVSSISGSYYNVVGLPTDLLYKRLKQLYGI
jgi:septum formation protein